MNSLLSFVLRVVLFLAGLVFAASLAVAFVLLLALWLARSAWAQLTGRRAEPFMMRVDPRGGFDRMVRRPGRPEAGAGDVIDVEAKPPQG